MYSILMNWTIGQFISFACGIAVLLFMSTLVPSTSSLPPILAPIAVLLFMITVPPSTSSLPPTLWYSCTIIYDHCASIYLQSTSHSVPPFNSISLLIFHFNQCFNLFCQCPTFAIIYFYLHNLSLSMILMFDLENLAHRMSK